MKYTEAEKRRMYGAGHYLLHVPPVYSGGWTVENWIRYIDGGGGIWKPIKNRP